MRNIILTLFSRHMPGILAAGFIGLFSHMAYSANPNICTPTGYVPTITINANLTVTPAGSSFGTGYIDSQPVALPGPITCASYTPSTAYVEAMGPTGQVVPTEAAYTPLGTYGFSALLTLGTTPGLASSGLPTLLSYDGNIPVNIYPAIFVYPPANVMTTQDFDVEHQLIGYIQVSGEKENFFSGSDTTGLTAVYFTGHIHIPPYCTYSPSESTIIMDTVFSSDFTAAGAGGAVGSPRHVAGTGKCSGGSTHGDGDLVHLSLTAGIPGNGSDIAGVSDMPDVGIKVYDNTGRVLPVDGSVFDTVATTESMSGGSYWGNFDYPLTFQLVSITGKAPPPTQSYFTFLTFGMTMD